jgi:hypothetical protein
MPARFSFNVLKTIGLDTKNEERKKDEQNGVNRAKHEPDQNKEGVDAAD